MKRLQIPSLALLIALGVSGCISSETRNVRERLPATNADDVRVYDEAPEGFRVLGDVEVSTDEVNGQGDMDEMTYELKRQAAMLGADGVLMERGGKGGEVLEPLITYKDGGSYYAALQRPVSRLRAQAIRTK